MPFDVGAVIRRVHFAWHAQGAGFSAGHSTYTVRAGAGGEWSFTPHHQPADAEPLRGSPLRIETVSVSRGGRLLAAPGRAEVSADGSLAVDRGAVVERLSNAEEGVRQSWAFARYPGGAGPLTVRLRAEGAAYVGETASGLHFADPSGLGMRYGMGLWTDASGARTWVPVRYEAGELVMEVPEEVVQTAAYPAVLSPLISPELGMDNPVLGPVVRSQSFPAVGSDGQNFLVVWQDSRSSGSTEVYDIFGTRVTPGGEVLDPAGLSISSAAGDQRVPAVAFDGQQYLVVWQDHRSGRARIHASRVTKEGRVLDPESIMLNEGPAAQTAPAVSFDGRSYLVAWQDARGGSAGSDIYGTRVSPAGLVLDPEGIIICAEPFTQTTPAIAFDGQNHFLVWQDYRDGTAHVYGARVSPEGTVLDGPGLAVSFPLSMELAPAVAFDGKNYLVVWQEDRNGLSYDIYGTWVTPAGTVLDVGGFSIVTANRSQHSPAVAFDGKNYLVVWQDARSDSAFDIHGARIEPDGTVLGTFPISTGAGGQITPAVASGGGYSLVVWSDSRSGSAADLYGARLEGAGGPLEPSGLLIATSANSQLAPAVASNGRDYLVVWQDDRGGTSDIYGVRVAADGTVRDPLGIPISTAVNHQLSPAVLYDGQGYFVVWQDHRGVTADIYGARVSGEGQVLDPGGIAVFVGPGNQLRPALASDGQRHLIVWSDERASFSSDIYGAWVGAQGGVLEPAGFVISAAANSQTAPAIAFDGKNYLVVWQDLRNGGVADVYGTRISPDGTVLDPGGLPLSRAPGAQTSVALAFGGQSYLVVWRDSRNPTSDIYATRVMPDGTVLDPDGLALASGPDDQGAPVVVSDGQHYVVAWQHTQSGGSSDIHGAQVMPDGSVLEPSSIPLSADPSDEVAPRLGAGGPGRLLLVYQRLDARAPYGTQRVRARFLTTEAL